MASLCAKQQKLKAWKERIATTSNSSVVGVLQCHLDCSLALFLVCSRSGSSTASLCLYFLQLCAFVEDFFILIVMILLLGSGYTQQLNCYESEITHTCSVQTCHCQTYSPCLTHNYQVLSSLSFTNFDASHNSCVANMMSDIIFQELCCDCKTIF